MTESLYGCIVAWMFGAGFVSILPLESTAAKILIPAGASIAGFGITIGEGDLAARCAAALARGFATALPIAFAVEGARSLGELIETGRGMTIGSITEPTSAFPELTLASIFRWLAVAGFAGPVAFHEDTWMSFLGIMIRYRSTIQIAGSFAAAYIAIEIFFAFLGRTISGISTHLECFITKGIASAILTAALADAAGAFNRI